MKKYVELELEVKSVNTIDILTTSPDRDTDSPGMPPDDDYLENG